MKYIWIIKIIIKKINFLSLGCGYGDKEIWLAKKILI